MTVHRFVSGLVIVAIAVGGAWYLVRKHEMELRRTGIVSERIVHDGETWRAKFVARIPAPETVVFDAIEHVENSRSDNVKSVRIVDQSGNRKTVAMEIAGPAGQTITLQVAFEYFPAEDRITYHTLNSPVLDTQAEYKLDGEGSDTLINYQETTRMLQNFPLPDAVVKQVIRGLFVSQLSGLRQTLDIGAGDDESDEGP